MKVKVVSLKNILKYFSKILLLMAIFAVFGKFFYKNKNSNVNFQINSSNFLAFLDNEIFLLKANSSNSVNINKAKYSEKTVQGELEFVKMVASNNYAYTNNINNMENENNEAETSENLQQVNGNITSVAENLVIPETRITNRSITIKCSR